MKKPIPFIFLLLLSCGNESLYESLSQRSVRVEHVKTQLSTLGSPDSIWNEYHTTPDGRVIADVYTLGPDTYHKVVCTDIPEDAEYLPDFREATKNMKGDTLDLTGRKFYILHGQDFSLVPSVFRGALVIKGGFFFRQSCHAVEKKQLRLNGIKIER